MPLAEMMAKIQLPDLTVLTSSTAIIHKAIF